VACLVLWASCEGGVADTPKVGMACKNKLQKVLDNHSIYQCKKTTSGLKWIKLQSQAGKIKISVTPIPKQDTTLPFASIRFTDIDRKTQSLIDSATLDMSVDSVPIDFYVEDGPNGPYPEIAKNISRYALEVFAGVGLNIPAKGFKIILGRTQEFIHSTSEKLGCSHQTTNFTASGNLGFCGSDQISVIESPMLDYIRPTSPDQVTTDLGSFTPTAIGLNNWKSQIPHEFFHTWQNDYQNLPLWLSEGGPQLLSFAIQAKQNSESFRSTVDTYIRNNNFNQNKCYTKIENLLPFCQYTEGIIANEMLFSKFGGFNVYTKFQNINSPEEFSKIFQETTGETLQVFYNEVDWYLKSIGWTAD
jgi:hypothetical protein